MQTHIHQESPTNQPEFQILIHWLSDRRTKMSRHNEKEEEHNQPESDSSKNTSSYSFLSAFGCFKGFAFPPEQTYKSGQITPPNFSLFSKGEKINKDGLYKLRRQKTNKKEMAF